MPEARPLFAETFQLIPAHAVASRARREGGPFHGRRFRSDRARCDRHRRQRRDRPRHGEGACARRLRGFGLGPQCGEEPRSRSPNSVTCGARVEARTCDVTDRAASRTLLPGRFKPSAGSMAASPMRAWGPRDGRPLSTGPRRNGEPCSRPISMASSMSSRWRSGT